MLTAPEGMGAGKKKQLPEITSAQHLTLAEGDVFEVVAGRAALKTAKADEFPVIDECPILHTIPDAYAALLRISRFCAVFG